MQFRTYKAADIKKGDVVLLRVDFNVPLKNGKIVSDFRMRLAVPEIKKLKKLKAKVVIVSHLGRPGGTRVSGLSQRVIAKRLAKLLGSMVQFSDEIVGDGVKSQISRMKDGGVMMLENVRFDAREEKNDKKFARELATLADVYVNNAFGVSLDNHASVSAIAKELPSFAGSLIITETAELSKPLSPPFVLVLGGMKLETKVSLIKLLAPKADAVLVGGGLAVTLLSAKHNKNFLVGEFEITKGELLLAKQILKKFGNKIILPSDVLVAKSFKASKLQEISVRALESDEYIFDIGSQTVESYRKILVGASSVVWNGPMGYIEKNASAHGTLAIGKIVGDLKSARTVVGGGDTVAFLEKNKLTKKINFVSSGGGAMLAFLSGQKMPGLVPLVI